MDLLKEIKRLKEEKGALIVAHNYQLPEVQDIADFVGDSLELSRKVSEMENKMVVFCGVKFMAETAKVLSPEKKILLPRPDAICPMAEMISAEELRDFKKRYPKAKVVAYVNTNADVKAEADVCCTSANAVKVVKNIEGEEIIFVPDRNLALWSARFVNGKKIIPWEGFCYLHRRINSEEVRKAKEIHPDAVVLAHPECDPSVLDLADAVLSTSQMLRYARESEAKKFIICTEMGLLHRLKKENPSKEFLVPRALMCRNMKLTKLEDVYHSLLYERYEIELPQEIISRSRRALERMLELV
ncbi:quinolinate synthase NadA [bacterium]|nr:quinolinate synthase NadA [bacterium]